MNDGKLPYEELIGEDDEERMAEAITAGARLPRPNGCLDELWALMEACWSVDPNSRPTLFDLGNKLADLSDLGRDGLDESEDSSDYDTATSELPDSYESDEESSSATINTQDDISDGSGSISLSSPRTPTRGRRQIANSSGSDGADMGTYG